METIIVESHGNGFKAYQASNPKVWEFGKTKADAVYQFMITLGLIHCPTI